MTLVEATELLTECHRSELRYHAFGDREVTWTLGTKKVASGYFSGRMSVVNVLDTNFLRDRRHCIWSLSGKPFLLNATMKPVPTTIAMEK